MSSYAKNKQQMCSVTQHQCRRRQMCRNVHKFIRYTHFLSVLILIEQIYSWQTFNSLGCPLMLRTNYRCVQSLNIRVDVAKCVENVHTLIHYTHFWTATKKDLSSLNNLFMTKFQLIKMSSYAKTNYRCVQSLNISVDVAKWVENVHKFTQFTQFLSVTKNDLF